MVLMKYIRANRTAPLYMLFWQSVFFLIGVVMVVIINAFLNEDPDFGCMGTLMAIIATVVGTMARGNINGYTRFRLAISMGNTRWSYLLCDPVVTALTSAVGVLTARLLYMGEQAFYAVLYPGFVNELPLDIIFRWWMVLILVGAAVLLDLVMSALTLRFGTKGFLVIWLGFCGCFMVLPRMVDAYESGSTSILARIGGAILTAIITIPVKGWIAIGIAFVLALLSFVVDTFRKAEVKL